jgi:hypothetical protein
VGPSNLWHRICGAGCRFTGTGPSATTTHTRSTTSACVVGASGAPIHLLPARSVKWAMERGYEPGSARPGERAQTLVGIDPHNPRIYRRVMSKLEKWRRPAPGSQYRSMRRCRPRPPDTVMTASAEVVIRVDSPVRSDASPPSLGYGRPRSRSRHRRAGRALRRATHHRTRHTDDRRSESVEAY